MFRTLSIEYKKPFIGFLIIYLIRLVIVLTMGIMPQDAYYYMYSEHLAMSYFDHPPMVAYMLKFFGLFFGKSVLAIKFTDFIISLLSFLAFYRLSRYFLSENRAFKATLFFGTTFLLTVISINTTPDVPLVFFWTLSLLFLYKSIYEKKTIYWAIAGFLIGLTFISKYTGIFLLFGLFGFLLVSNRHRKHLSSFKILLLLSFFLIGISPVVYWNYSHDWASFAFQTANRADNIREFNVSPGHFFGNYLVQMLLLIPFLFLGTFVILYKMSVRLIRKRELSEEKNLFLLAFALPIVSFFVAVSLVYWVKLNWMIPGYISAIILVSPYLGRKVLNGQVITSLILHLLLVIQVLFYPFNIKSDDTWFGWKEFTQEMDTRMEEYPDSFLFADDDYKTSAVLDFYLDRKIYAGNVIGHNGKQFYLIDPDLNHLNGTDAIFIDSEKGFKQAGKSGKTPDILFAYFENVEELDPILIGKEDGKPLRKFLLFRCSGYNPKGIDKTID